MKQPKQSFVYKLPDLYQGLLQGRTPFGGAIDPGLGLLEKYDRGGGGFESLRISVLEAMYGFRVSFLSLRIFSGYKFNVMAVSRVVCAFHFENISKKRDCCIYYEVYL